MVRWPGAAEAARYAVDHPDLTVGLHLDLGEWAFRNGGWEPIYEVVPKNDAGQVAEEIARQLAAFRSLLGREPTHMDSHQHVHREEPVRSLLMESAHRIGIPLRLFSEVQYCGSFYGQLADGSPLPDYISVEALKGLITDLPSGITELGCHPAKEIDFDTMYTGERLLELEILCDSRVREFLASQAVELSSFSASHRAGDAC
jgi:predicted glycoside hydrolase/deacetylase ChbG (UPF0249 family)